MEQSRGGRTEDYRTWGAAWFSTLLPVWEVGIAIQESVSHGLQLGLYHSTELKREQA